MVRRSSIDAAWSIKGLFCRRKLRIIGCYTRNYCDIASCLAAYYGLRRSEVIGLKWSAIISLFSSIGNICSNSRISLPKLIWASLFVIAWEVSLSFSDESIARTSLGIAWNVMRNARKRVINRDRIFFTEASCFLILFYHFPKVMWRNENIHFIAFFLQIGGDNKTRPKKFGRA